MSGILSVPHALFDENNEIHPEMTVELPVQEGGLSKPTCKETKLKPSRRKKVTDDRRTPCARRCIFGAEGDKVKASPKEKKQGGSVAHVPAPDKLDLLQKRVDAMRLHVRGLVEEMKQREASFMMVLKASEPELLLSNSTALGGLQRHMVLNKARDILIQRYGFKHRERRVDDTVVEKQKAVQLARSRLNAADAALLSDDALHMALTHSTSLVRQGANDVDSASKKMLAWAQVCKFTNN